VGGGGIRKLLRLWTSRTVGTTRAPARSSRRWSSRPPRGTIGPVEHGLNLKFTGLTHNLGQLYGSYRDFQSNCWVNLRILGQPCEFYLLAGPWTSSATEINRVCSSRTFNMTCGADPWIKLIHGSIPRLLYPWIYASPRHRGQRLK
jgi:hypothetical protein